MSKNSFLFTLNSRNDKKILNTNLKKKYLLKYENKYL